MKGHRKWISASDSF